MTDHQTAALRRSIEVGSVGPDGLEVTVEASEAERRALASLNALIDVRSFVAHLRLSREGSAGIAISGTLRAVVRRTCVVTLEAFDTQVTEPIDLHFLPERELDALRSEAERRGGASPGWGVPSAPDGVEDEPDLPDPIVRGRIDVGVVAAEFLALGLDPYPRMPGASFTEPPHDGAMVSPFAALARLKDLKDT